MRKAFIETLCEAAQADPRIHLLTADLGYSVLEPFAGRFPGQFVNVGVAEQNMMGIAAGLALSGKIVFTYSIANFPIFRCLEQIRNDVCHHNANVKIVAVGAGFSYGPLGYTHHAVEDLAVMNALPHMTILAPGDPVETRLATKALVEWQGPCYLRLGKASEPVIHQVEPKFQIGRAILMRSGSNLTIISVGTMLKTAIEVAEKLESEGISSTVLSLATFKPFDRDTVIAAIRKTKNVVTLEEHSFVGGLGTLVEEVIVEAGLAEVRFLKLALSDRASTTVGTQEYLREQSSLTTEKIFKTVTGRFFKTNEGQRCE